MSPLIPAAATGAAVLFGLCLLWLPLPAAIAVRRPGAREEADASRRGLRDRLRRTASPAQRAAWISWVRQLGSVLRAGRSAQEAFQASADAAGQVPRPTPVSCAQERVGHDVDRAVRVGRGPHRTLAACAGRLERDHDPAVRAGAGTVQALAGCWSIAEETGAPLADLLDGLAEALEADLDAQAARDSALAGSRATVRILTWLPAVALLLGVVVGADPLRVLLGTPAGMAAGLVGALLMGGGHAWSTRLVRAAESAGSSPAAAPGADPAPPKDRPETRGGRLAAEAHA